MKIIFTKHHHNLLRAFAALSIMLFSGWNASAQITTTDCQNIYSYCSVDTVKLQPSDLSTYTNYVWYGTTVDPANEIDAGNAASFNVDPTRLGDSTIYVLSPGGTYILTAEYDTPSGCATKNDTLIINFLPTPDLVTVADTICTNGGESIDLNTLLVDNNAVDGDTSWYMSLANAQDEDSPLGSSTVNPGSTTKYYVRVKSTATDAETEPCYAIDSLEIEVRCLNLGNLVWFDTNNDGVKDVTEAVMPGVKVELFLDANGDGSLVGAEQTPYSTDVTDGTTGLYLFENLPEGKYFVGIPGTEFDETTDPLYNLYSSGTTAGASGVTTETTAPDPDATVSDTDDNGMTMKAGFYTGGVLTTASVMLNFQDEPTLEDPDNSSIDDLDDNLTVDFGFHGMSLGSLVFMDTDNTGSFDNADMGIAGVPVILYASDGTTVVQSTTTDADGQYLFTGLAEGTYIVAIDTTDSDLDGKISSDDIGTSGTPTTDDNDDNGVNFNSTEVRSNPIVLTAGGASESESDQGETATGMSDPSVTDNSSVTDDNSELHVDFGFKPVCPTIDNPMGAQTICAGDAGIDLSVDISVDSTVAFVRFDDKQTGTDMYTGSGTQVGSDVTPIAGTATYTFNTADFPNASNTTADTFYVYGIFANPPADATCRPYQEIEVIVNPNPTAANASLTLCESSLGDTEAVFTLSDADATVLGGQSGMTVTYHNTQADADNDADALPNSLDTSSVTLYVRVETAEGCYETSELTITVNPLPDFTLTLPTTCPGDEPTVMISNLTNGVNPNTMQVNSETAVPYVANTVFTTADGLNLNAVNSVTVVNGNTCSQTKTIAVPDITPLVCPPVNVNVLRSGE